MAKCLSLTFWRLQYRLQAVDEQTDESRYYKRVGEISMFLRFHTSWTTAVVVVFGTCSVAFGDEPAPKSTAKPPAVPVQVRTDLFGDPLPAGAVMRLGTVGFRVANVAAVGFRPSGELVAFAEDLSLHVWPADGTPKPRVTTVGEKRDYGWRLALSPDARYAAAMLQRKLVVWDVSGDKPIELLSRGMADAYMLCFSPAGHRLVVNEEARNGDKQLLLCDLEAKTWESLPFPGRYPESLSFSRDAKSLAVAAAENVVVIDVATKKERRRLLFPRERPAYAALNPDGSIVAMQTTDWVNGPVPKVRLFEVSSGKEVDGLKPPTGPAQWTAFAPDGKTLLSGHALGMRQWDPVAGKVVREISGPANHPVVYSANDQRLASHSRGAILLWDVANAKHVRPELAAGGHTDIVLGVTTSPDGKLVATNSLDGEVRIWARATGRMLCKVRSSWGNDRRVAFLPDSKSFIAVAIDGLTPVVWDIASGRELRRFTVAPGVPRTDFMGDLRISVDGRTLTTVLRPGATGQQAYILSWDIGTGREVARVELPADPHDLETTMASRSRDGRWALSHGVLTSLRTGDKFLLLPPANIVFGRARFSDDGRRAGEISTPRVPRTIDWDRCTLAIFDIEARARVAELPTGMVLGFEFSPDARQVAVVGHEAITLWDIPSGKEVRRFATERRNGMTNAIAFTSDSRWLITGHDNCTALVWDLAGKAPQRAGGEPRLSTATLERMWALLAGDDAARAFATGWELVDHPEQAVALLRTHLKPARAADAGLVARLVAKLGAPAFAEREAASKELLDIGEAAIPALRVALKTHLSIEQKSRVERLLKAADGPFRLTGEQLRQVRAVSILEHVGNAEARRLLEVLAEGTAEARQTREAAESLLRMKSMATISK